MVKKIDIIVEHINNEVMVVDLLTKGLRPVDFKSHIYYMGVLGSFDILG